jgi:hypothetical protein
VKSAARWGIFVWWLGVRMACVEGGCGGLYIASGNHEGRHGGTRVNQRRGQLQNQRGGAFVRFAPFSGRAFAWHACVTQCEGTEAFASHRGSREGRVGHGRTSAGAGAKPAAGQWVRIRLHRAGAFTRGHIWAAGRDWTGAGQHVG